MHEYSAADLSSLFDLPARFLSSLAAAGYITPIQSSDVTRYTFSDLRLLRTAGALRQAKIPARKILAALALLRDADLTPADASLAIAPSGREVAIRHAGDTWTVDSKQYALPLAMQQVSPLVSPLRLAPPATGSDDADRHFDLAFAAEDTDLPTARSAYEKCLEADPGHAEARVNLGRLLHLTGELTRAEALYRQAPVHTALLHFNLAVVLEDLDRPAEAIDRYNQALAADPMLHDAHFNLARLHEAAQQPREALRHLLAFRRLSGQHQD
jgi:tetratricopeptide (TPR) repeat protein